MKYLLTAKRLRQALNECGIRPQDLSDRSGVSKASISQYLNGSHKPSNTSSGKMAEVLNVNPLWLMGFDVGKEMECFKSDREYNTEEKKIISKYRIADDNTKEMVKRILFYKSGMKGE